MYTENILKVPLNEMVCYCTKVTKGRILAAIQEGARSLDAIKTATGTCSMGKCKELSPRKK
jgi:nitrite reductase (NADH) large subunit